MKISGFTFVKNATKLYIPAKQSIASILPIVDEFIVVLGKGDHDDNTRQEIESLQNDKIKIIDSEWETEKFAKNTIFAQQTDIAKSHCTGDWLFYLQCDEAVHEKYLPLIKKAAIEYLNDTEVEGLLFRYKHFWGDYEHYNPSHAFYPREIRVIRNIPEIHSWRDAQSFRVYNHFEPSMVEYLRKEGTRKLKVATIPAEIYHYGWVRPPAMMRKKQKSNSTSFRGKSATDQLYQKSAETFNYGPMNRVKLFKDTHPASMADWIATFNWGDQLQKNGKRKKTSQPEKYERLKYRILTWIEQNLLFGKKIGEFKNFVIVRSYKGTKK
jgi:hypothetical protein